MEWRHIKGMLLQEYFVTLRSMEILVDVFFFPVLNIVIFGFISLYLAGSHPEAGQNVLLGMVLWQIIWIIAYSVATESLWNIWSKNLSNMFIAPLRLHEYVFSHFLSGMVKALTLIVLAGLFCDFAFGLNILSIGVATLFLVFVLFALFAFAVGIFVLGLIFCYGLRIQALAWSLILIFEPLTSAFFPVSVLPRALQIVAYALPPTYGFEAAREAFSTHTVNLHLFGIGFALAVLYCIPAMIAFKYFFDRSRNSGQFARNEA